MTVANITANNATLTERRYKTNEQKRKPPARQSAPAAARGSVPEANPQPEFIEPMT